MRSIIEVLLADFLWGFGFVATVWSLETFTSLQILTLRFLLACLVLFPFIMKSLKLKVLWQSVLPGVLLALTIGLQIIGLTYTSASKSAFITVLYVLIIPLLERVVLQRAIPLSHWLGVLLSMFGVGSVSKLLMIQDGRVQLGSYGWNQGDTLTLLAAFFAACHIFSIDRISRKHDKYLEFTFGQFLFAGISGAVLLWYQGDPLVDLAMIGDPMAAVLSRPVVSLFALALGPTIIAFYLQTRIQKKINPALASLLFLIEAPMAAALAGWFLGESWSRAQYLGGALILIGCSISIFGYAKRRAAS